MQKSAEIARIFLDRAIIEAVLNHSGSGEVLTFVHILPVHDIEGSVLSFLAEQAVGVVLHFRDQAHLVCFWKADASAGPRNLRNIFGTTLGAPVARVVHEALFVS